MAFCTIAQLTARWDRRIVGQVSNDDGTGTINTTNVTAALDDGSADISLAAIQGGIYTAAQLDQLSTDSDPALIRLCADLSVRHLAHRRFSGIAPELESRFKQSMELLEMIKKGSRAFNVDVNRSAEQPNLIQYSALQIENLESLTATSFFGGAKKTPTVNG